MTQSPKPYAPVEPSAFDPDKVKQLAESIIALRAQFEKDNPMPDEPYVQEPDIEELNALKKRFYRPSWAYYIAFESIEDAKKARPVQNGAALQVPFGHDEPVSMLLNTKEQVDAFEKRKMAAREAAYECTMRKIRWGEKWSAVLLEHILKSQTL